MKILNLFQTKLTKEVNNFANSLASDIAKRYPPELDKTPTKKPSINRLTRILEETAQKAQEFQATNNLGTYGKAKLGNAFRWALIDLGYSKEFIELATEAIIVHISKSAKR